MLGLWRKLMMRELNGFESHFAAWRRCLHCVEKKVEYCAMQQIVIANDDQRSRWKQFPNRDPLGSVGVSADESCGVTPYLDDVKTAHAGNAGPRKIEEFRQ